MYDLKLEHDNEKGQKCSCDQFRYLYNTKRKEYVDSFKILPSYVGEYNSEINFVKLDAYSLLIAIGTAKVAVIIADRTKISLAYGLRLPTA